MKIVIAEGLTSVLPSGAVADCQELRDMGFTGIFSATPEGMPMEEALMEETAKKNLREAAARIIKEIQAASGKYFFI